MLQEHIYEGLGLQEYIYISYCDAAGLQYGIVVRQEYIMA